jgi:two-component system sensor histidine kinase KdpD
MSELVSNVLDLVRFQSGRVALRREWQSLEDLLGAALRNVEARLGNRQVEIALPADLPAVYVDARLVSQVLVNLLENVAKHTPAGTHARVAARTEGDVVHLAVEDDGPGLPPGDPEMLFAKFQRGRHESEVPGAGLGLAICRAIVEAHGGRVSASQRPGGGARFEVTLPARGPSP